MPCTYVPVSVSRIECGTIRSYGAPLIPGRVLERMFTTPSLAEITIVPFQVGFSGEPEVIGMTEVSPSRTTVIRWVSASTAETCERPMANGSSRSTPP